MANSARPRGIHHVGVTVPHLEAATRFHIEALRAAGLYDTLPKEAALRPGDVVEGRLDSESR